MAVVSAVGGVRVSEGDLLRWNRAGWQMRLYFLCVCCSALQCNAMCCSALQCIEVCCNVVLCVGELCCIVEQGVAVCCSVLQCVAKICCVGILRGGVGSCA